MMSSAVTSAGASERDIRKRLGLAGWRALSVAETVENAEIGEDTAAGHDVFYQGRIGTGDRTD